MELEDIRSTTEKIKLQEQDAGNKIKEKREQDAAIAVLNRAIYDATVQAEQSQQEQEKLIKDTDSLRKQELLEKTRRDALFAQLDALNMELKELRAKSHEEISKLWEMRSSFCNEIHSITEACDVWALLMKPNHMKPLSPISRNKRRQPQSVTNSENENRLRRAIERRTKAITERDRLAAEPDNVEEFVRNIIKQKSLIRLLSTELKENEPIKFSTSNAAKRKVLSVFRNTKIDTMPWYQPYIVVGSVAVFLIYFCILREENDVDQEFNKTLYDRIKGLEKEQLLQCYKFNKENGKSVTDIERRLQEIEAEEAKLAA